MDKIIYREECYKIQGAVFAVYREMGCGFLEAVYQECLEKEFGIQQIPYVAWPELQLAYRGYPLKQTYRPDFLCYGKIIVELKAVKALAPEHEAQVLNYLKASNNKVGLLVNFGSYPKAMIRRFVN